MRTVFFCILLVALISAGCSTGESNVRAGYNFGKLDKVAVVEVAGAVEGETAKNQIGDFFGMELLKKGYTPVERAQVQTLLKEQEFQATDITSNEGAARAGRILNVPAVLVVNIPNYGKEMSMTAKMVDVEDGSILWIGSGTAKTGRLLSTIAGAAAGAAAGVVVAGDDTDDKVVGGIIGGVLGGVAGQALTPQQEQQVRKMTKKMCKDLPLRM